MLDGSGALEAESQCMKHRGIALAAVVGLAVTGCSGSTAPVATASPPQPVTAEQILQCGTRGLEPETLEPAFSNPAWTTPELAAVGLGASRGATASAKPWKAVSSLPSPVGHDEDLWVVYSATEAPVAIVSVSPMPDRIRNSTALPVGPFMGGVELTCKH